MKYFLFSRNNDIKRVKAWGQVLPKHLMNAHEQVSLGVEMSNSCHGGVTGRVPPGGEHGRTFSPQPSVTCGNPWSNARPGVPGQGVHDSLPHLLACLTCLGRGPASRTRKGTTMGQQKGDRELLRCRVATDGSVGHGGSSHRPSPVWGEKDSKPG